MPENFKIWPITSYEQYLQEWPSSVGQFDKLTDYQKKLGYKTPEEFFDKQAYAAQQLANDRVGGILERNFSTKDLTEPTRIQLRKFTYQAIDFLRANDNIIVEKVRVNQTNFNNGRSSTTQLNIDSVEKLVGAAAWRSWSLANIERLYISWAKANDIPYLLDPKKFYDKDEIDHKLSDIDDKKQDKLVAGEGIKIDGVVISSNNDDIKEYVDKQDQLILKQSKEYTDDLLDKKQNKITLLPNQSGRDNADWNSEKSELRIWDPQFKGATQLADIEFYTKKGTPGLEIVDDGVGSLAYINDHYPLKKDVTDALLNKQDKLVAGDNIIIQDNVISATSISRSDTISESFDLDGETTRFSLKIQNWVKDRIYSFVVNCHFLDLQQSIFIGSFGFFIRTSSSLFEKQTYQIISNDVKKLVTLAINNVVTDKIDIEINSKLLGKMDVKYFSI